MNDYLNLLELVMHLSDAEKELFTLILAYLRLYREEEDCRSTQVLLRGILTHIIDANLPRDVHDAALHWQKTLAGESA